nr:NACHT domain-containing protein [Acidovorax sp. D4N7]
MKVASMRLLSHNDNFSGKKLAVEPISLISLARLAAPIINEILKLSKKAGTRGLQKWEASSFPRKIATRIKSLDTVRTIWKSQPLSLQTFFHPPKLAFQEKPEFVTRLSAFEDNAVIIEGIVGQGKSIFLRSLAINEITSNDAQRLPLFIELKDLSIKTDLQGAIFRALESYDIDIDEATIDFLFKSGKFSLLLDGFDEIEEKLVKAVYLHIEHLARRYPELLIVVTSRPGNEIQKSPTFKTLRIAELTPAEFPAFLTKLGVSSEKSLELRQAIRNSPSKLSNLIKTPLMLTLVVIVYEAEVRIPETLPEFFDRLFQVVVSNHDRLKGGFTRVHQSGLSERGLQTVFEAFCFMTLQLGHNRTLTADQFEEVFKYAIKYSDGLKCDADNFKADITNTACLMLMEGIDSITYLHKSILDYYAASFVRKLNEKNSSHFYQAMLKKTLGWEDVLSFLKSIDSFRYSQKFILPFVASEKEIFCCDLSKKSPAELSNIMEAAYPNFGLCFQRNTSPADTATIISFQTEKERAGEHLAGLVFLIMEALDTMMPSPFPIKEIEDLFKIHFMADAIDAEEIFIPGKSIINAFGTKEICTKLGIYETRLEKLRTVAQEVVDAENKKELIFTLGD